MYVARFRGGKMANWAALTMGLVLRRRLPCFGLRPNRPGLSQLSWDFTTVYIRVEGGAQGP